MNWYIMIKSAAIWTMPADDFITSLIWMYKCEYQLHHIKQSSPGQNPRRIENVKNKLKQTWENAARNIKSVLVQVFKKWISEHALTDPQQWARHRIEETTKIDSPEYGGIIGAWREAHRYQYKDNANMFLNDMLNQAMQNPKAWPSTQAYLQIMAEEYKDSLAEDAIYDLDWASDNFGQEFKDADEAEQYIKALPVEDVMGSVMDLIGSDDIHSFINNIKAYDSTLANGMALDAYANITFPLWFAHWADEGIEGVQQQNKQVLETLDTTVINADTPQGLQDAQEAVQMALNATHMGGDMTQYVEEHTGINESEIKKVFDELSASTNKHQAQWDEELQHFSGQTVLV